MGGRYSRVDLGRVVFRGLALTSILKCQGIVAKIARCGTN